jgi:hypothetical protein
MENLSVSSRGYVPDASRLFVIGITIGKNFNLAKGATQ